MSQFCLFCSEANQMLLKLWRNSLAGPYVNLMEPHGLPLQGEIPLFSVLGASPAMMNHGTSSWETNFFFLLPI